MNRDWRFANNPLRKKLGEVFLAAAPLRVIKDNVVVDLGSLVVHDDIPREDFSVDRQQTLLSLAGLLIYQLSTLQSEHMEQRSSTMYETCISFLRRGVSHGTLLPPAPLRMRRQLLSTVNVRSTSRDDASQAAKSKVTRHDKNPYTARDVDRMESKTGPREVQGIRSQVIRMEREILQDYSETLRSMFNADSVALIGLEDFQLFVKSTTVAGSSGEPDIESVITAFIMGEPCPPTVEPIVYSDESKAGVPMIPIIAPQFAAFHFGAELT